MSANMYSYGSVGAGACSKSVAKAGKLHAARTLNNTRHRAGILFWYRFLAIQPAKIKHWKALSWPQNFELVAIP